MGTDVSITRAISAQRYPSGSRKNGRELGWAGACWSTPMHTRTYWHSAVSVKIDFSVNCVENLLKLTLLVRI